MDPSFDLVNAKASGIPRLSKLPLRRAAPNEKDGSSFQSNQKPKFGKLTSHAPVKRPNASTNSTRTVVKSEPNAQAKGNEVPTRSQNSLKDTAKFPQESHVLELENFEPADSDTGDGPRSPPNALSSPVRTGQGIRKPRASLSDRTIETLSQIPPSPSPYRKKSGFFTDESPMQPPSRPVSALNHSRSSSRTRGSSFSVACSNGRPQSPSRRLVTAPNYRPSAIASPTPSRRAVSSFAPKPAPLNLQGHDSIAMKSISKLQQPSPTSVSTAQADRISKPLTGSKTCAIRPSRMRPSATSLFDGPKTRADESMNATNWRSRQEQQDISRNREKGIVATESKSRSTRGPVGNATSATIQEPQEATIRKTSSSSMTLRQTIAAAKAARKAALKDTPSSSVIPRSAVESQPTLGVPDLDPFTLDLSDSSTNNAIRRRINAARGDGRLNIAALGLSGIPEEVTRMYDQEAANAGGIAWYECVDLVRLNAADNGIKELDDSLFPDILSGAVNEMDEDQPDRVFASLELIDMHGNSLSTLPIGLARLDRLTNLNLSRNRLTNDSLEIIGEIKTLRELRMSENLLQGPLSECLCKLDTLETLDIHNNAISSLPRDFARLSRLKILTLSDNKLSILPFETMNAFPLVELDASKNRLSGSLFPSNVSEFPFLRSLLVSENALDSFSKDTVDLPSLQVLNVARNKISGLPNIGKWKDLASFTAGYNQLTSLPEGLVFLTAIKTIDVSDNKLTRLDDRLGLMGNLQLLEVKNNPIRERRLLTLNLEDLKAELRNRLTATESLKSPMSPTATTKFFKTGEVTNDNEVWTVESSILDRSNSKLRDIEHSNLMSVLEGNVRTLVLHHNVLQEIPLAIADLGFSLTVLDISNNKLGQTNAFLTQRLPLPNLQTLNLTSNSLSSLSSLIDNLFAPSLGTLNISFNRLTNLPPLRESFVGLTKLLASNNMIVELDLGSVRGLQVLDVSSNEIAYLPPKLALLQGELKTLMVGGNRFRVPGWGVVQKGTEEILNWLRMRIPEGEEGALVEEVDSVD